MENTLDYLRIKQKKKKGNNKEKTIFNVYQESKDIATKMMKSFVNFYNKDEKGFPLDSINIKRIGIISNCMALSTFIELKNMNANTREYNDIFRTLIERVFKDIYPDDEHPVFTAAPYTNDPNITTYMETVSKVLITIVDLRAYFIKKMYNEKIDIEELDFLGMYNAPILIKGKEYSSFESILQPLEQLIVDCICLINESCLKIEDSKSFDYVILGSKKVKSYKKKEDKIRYKGWSFHKPETENGIGYEPSIYFTYHVTNAFLNFFKSFDHMMRLEYDDESDMENNELTPREIIFNSLAEEEKDKFKMDESFFKLHKSIINDFRNQVISSGRYFDSLLMNNNVDLGYDLINADLTPISAIQLNNSSYSSVLLDTTFLLAIFINAGIDDDYAAVDEGEYLYNQFSYSLNNIKKVYDAKFRKSFEDSVATYKFGEEKVPAIAAEKFKNIRIDTSSTSVYDLIPLYCNTYSTMFDYLIKYPQKEMISNLKWVLDNKADGNSNWYWSKRGFNVNNNLYYVFAVESFYDYYEKYESDFAKTETDLDKKYQGKIDSYESKINGLKTKLEQAAINMEQAVFNKEKELNHKILELEKARDEKKSPLDIAVEEKINSEIQMKIKNSMDKYFAEILRDISKLKRIDIFEKDLDKKDAQTELIIKDSIGVQTLLATALFDKLKVNPDDCTTTSSHEDQVTDRIQEKIVHQLCTRLIIK